VEVNGIDISSEEVKGLFERYDKDKDGRIIISEVS